MREIELDITIFRQTKYLIFHILIKANIEFFFSYLFLPQHCQISPVMVNLLLDFTSAVFHLKAQSVEPIFCDSMFTKAVRQANEKHSW